MSVGLDTAIGRLADRQHGVVTRPQLLAIGLSDGSLEYRLRDHRLVRLHAGVYAVGHRAIRPSGRLLAAVLACGPTAVLSHKSAGALWELLVTDQQRIDVTVPGTSRTAQAGIRVHRTRRLHPDETTTIGGIPITSVARTIIDLAGVQSHSQRQRTVEQAERNGCLNVLALQIQIDRRPNERGAKHLRRLLSDYVGAPPTRSELERRFLDLVSQAGLPRPLINHKVAGLEVDFFWPQWRLVVELDGRAYHSDSRTFERDRTRDARLQRAGCRVLRVTYKRMVAAPAQIIDDIKALGALAER